MYRALRRLPVLVSGLIALDVEDEFPDPARRDMIGCPRNA